MRRFIFLLLCLPACIDTTPWLEEVGLRLSVDYTGCTETWLRLNVAPAQGGRIIDIVRDGARVQQIQLFSSDTVVEDQGLSPHRVYKYQIFRLQDGKAVEASVPVSVTTMVTTSHDFTWDATTLGDGNSSVLYDVGIISDTLAYAVGEIYLRDSTGQLDPQAYNLAKWDGHQWTLHRVRYQGGAVVARWILGFSDQDIWIGEHVHWDGSDFRFLFVGDPIFSGVRTNKAWGNSSGDFYVVGDGGFAARFDGSSWKRLESGTTVDIQDIWGILRISLGREIVLLAASNKYFQGEKKLLSVNAGGNLETLPWPMQDRRLHSIWFDRHSPLFVCGGGVYRSMADNSWKEVTEVPLIFTNRIRGNGANDIIVVGDFGLVAHYNGLTWKTYPSLALSQGNYESVAMSRNLVIAVGWSGQRGVLIVGRR